MAADIDDKIPTPPLPFLSPSMATLFSSILTVRDRFSSHRRRGRRGAQILPTDCNRHVKSAIDVDLDHSTDRKPLIRNEIWRKVFVLLFGQLISVCFAVFSFASSYIAEMGVDMPFTQSMAVYIPLAVIYGGIVLNRRQNLMVPWYCYVILAVVDVHGNFLSIKSFQYTSITSVTLLYCWNIPWAIILTYFVLRTRYCLWQLLGAAICVVGLVLAVLSDAVGSGDDGSHHLLGDTLVIAGTFCFALSNVGQEFCVKRKDLVEVLAMLGVFGALVALCEISIFERKDLASVKWSPTLIATFAAYSVAQFLTTTMAAFLLKTSGCALLNLSLLTSNMWALLISVFFYEKQVNWLYFLAFAFAAVGLIMYSLNDATPTSETSNEDLEATAPYQSPPVKKDQCGGLKSQLTDKETHHAQ